MIYSEFSEIPPLAYDLIMADPPWNFRNYSEKGTKKGAASHYTLMSLADIAKLPVGHLAQRDCVLWLWALNPMLPQALEVMEHWGFTFKTAGHWVKRGETGRLAFGTGYILRAAGEPFLIGTLGNPQVSRSVRSVVEGPRRAHSQKPDQAFRAAEQLMPNARRIELFSRTSREGWDAFGNEVGKLT